MQGKTNAVTSSGGSSGGTTVTAVNKTGKAIAKGDKVWLNSNAKIAGSKYSFGNTLRGYLDRTGTFASTFSTLYNIGDTAATEAGKFTSDDQAFVKYGADNSLFCGISRRDGSVQYRATGNQFIADDYTYDSYKIYKINMQTGEALQTWTGAGSSQSYDLWAYGAKVGNYFYALSSNYPNKLKLEDDGTYSRTAFTKLNWSASYIPVGVTADNKYILCGQRDSNQFLTILEVVNEDTIKVLNQSEMPADLQEFYSASCYATFNPYTGVLAVVKGTSSSNRYAIMQYSNGNWAKLSIALDLTDISNYAIGAMTLSDDLSRACVPVRLKSGDNNSSYIFNLSTTSGFAAMPYRFYTNSEDTITGYALEDALPDGSLSVSVASIPSVTANVSVNSSDAQVFVNGEEV